MYQMLIYIYFDYFEKIYSEIWNISFFKNSGLLWGGWYAKKKKLCKKNFMMSIKKNLGLFGLIVFFKDFSSSPQILA